MREPIPGEGDNFKAGDIYYKHYTPQMMEGK